MAARAPADQMAQAAGAVAATNADYFNLFEDASHAPVQPTNAASGSEISNGRLPKGPVPLYQRFGEWGPRPLNDSSEVFGVTYAGRAVVGNVRLKGTVTSRAFGKLALGGLNRYGIARGRIDAFTSDWGSDASAPPAAARSNVAIPAPPTWLSAAHHRAGRVIPAGLDVRPAPRTTIGVSHDGRHVYLVEVDGRGENGAALSIAEMAELSASSAPVDAVTFDGGGSAAMVGRTPVTVTCPCRTSPATDPYGQLPTWSASSPCMRTRCELKRQPQAVAMIY